MVIFEGKTCANGSELSTRGDFPNLDFVTAFGVVADLICKYFADFVLTSTRWIWWTVIRVTLLTHASDIREYSPTCVLMGIFHAYCAYLLSHGAVMMWMLSNMPHCSLHVLIL